MITYADARMSRLFDVAGRASEELHEKQHQRSLASFREVTARLEGVGLTSGWAAWGTAVNLDRLGDLAMAFETIQASLRLDPLSPSALRSFEVIANRLREAIANAAPTDASVPTLYALLQQTDDADVPTHLAMVRHLAATKQLERAAALAEAVTLLAPASRDAWLARANVARLGGDEAGAAGFEAEARVRELDELPLAPITTKGKGA